MKRVLSNIACHLFIVISLYNTKAKKIGVIGVLKKHPLMSPIFCHKSI
jgi:hypothetical protein